MRLWGIEAAERNETDGKASTRALADLADGQQLHSQIIDIDRYDRVVARCNLPDGRDGAR